MTGPARAAHVIKRVKGCAGYPVDVVAFDTETLPEDDGETQALRIGWAIYKRMDQGTYDKKFFRRRKTFWDFVVSKARPGRVLWLVAHNIGFDLSVLKFQQAMTRRGWVLDPEESVMPDAGGGPLYLQWRKGSLVIRMQNLANWYGMTKLANIGEAIGLAKGSVEFDTEDEEELSRYCFRDTEIVMEAVEYWTRFAKEHDLGPCKMTLAGQSFATWRHRFMNNSVFLHDNEGALRLERDSYLGARTEAFFIGRADCTVLWHKVDVNSLYPSIMLKLPVPVKMIGHYHAENYLGDPIRAVKKELKNGRGIIARVVIETDKTCAPILKDSKLMYVVGNFQATLTTPELVKCLEMGVVQEIVEWSVYEMAVIFKDYVECFYRLRKEYKSHGNVIFDMICKLLLNSLYGKFGQYTYSWEDAPPELEMAEQGYLDAMDIEGNEFHLRRLGDVTQIRSETKHEAYNGSPAIAAHITAYARVRITELMEAAGEPEVLYMDTDSLFTTPLGYQRLLEAGEIDDSTLGKMKLEDTSYIVRIYGLKYYKFGTDAIKIKGVRKDAEKIGKYKYRQDQFQGWSGRMRAGNPDKVKVSKIIKVVKPGYNKAIVLGNGRTTPFRVAVIS